MTYYEEFFSGPRPSVLGVDTWERAYKAFKARGEAEAEEKLRCWCPDGGHCVYSPDGLTGSHCNHPSNKPPEPECDHGCRDIKTGRFVPYKDFGDRHCRGCGDRLR